MFPLGHVTYSLATPYPGRAEQCIGALIADAATMQAFGWDDFHEADNVESFSASLQGNHLSDFVCGLRHHIELDERSHNSWAARGGYAYEKQTPELRSCVQQACGVDDELAQSLSHNFIESAVDLQLAAHRPAQLENLQNTLASFDSYEVSVAIAQWKQSDVQVTRARLDAFLDLWTRHDLSTIDAMVGLWGELLVLLKTHTFRLENATNLNADSAKAALTLAMDIVRSDYLDVVDPSRQ
jgi:hypothetical protein